MKNTGIKPNDCPTPEYHDTHRYCPSCDWDERVLDGKEDNDGGDGPELPGAAPVTSWRPPPVPDWVGREGHWIAHEETTDGR